MILVPILIVLLGACGGGGDGNDDRVLQFTGRDETESNFRSRTKEIRADNPGLWVQMCATLEGKTSSQAAALLIDEDGVPSGSVKGATNKPGQKANPDHLIRAAEIVQEECKR